MRRRRRLYLREPAEAEPGQASAPNGYGRVWQGVFVVVVIGALAASAWSRGRDTATASAPTAPAWRPGTTGCRRAVFDHVHHPTRLILLARCSTARGVVQAVKYQPQDGDWEVRLAPDAESARSLPKVNRGVLVARVIPTDLGHVALPAVGDRADVYGAWVLNKNRSYLAEMHPAWAIAVRGGPTRTRPAPMRRPLRVSVDAPDSSGVGELLPLRTSATTPSRRGEARPEGQVQLFVELTAGSGRAVDWKAATTNTLGAVTINMVALHVPGSYVVNVYAFKRGRQAYVRLPLTIRRRGKGNVPTQTAAVAPAADQVAPRAPSGGRSAA